MEKNANGTTQRGPPASWLLLGTLLEPTEHHTLAEVAKRVPKGIVCLLTALWFHGLGTQNPRDVWLAVDRRAGIPKIDFTPVRLIRMSGAALSTGIDEQNVDGVRVR